MKHVLLDMHESAKGIYDIQAMISPQLLSILHAAAQGFQIMFEAIIANS